MENEQLIEQFYQETPLQVGTGAALSYAEKCADITLEHMKSFAEWLDGTGDIWTQEGEGFWTSVKKGVQPMTTEELIELYFKQHP